MPKTFHPCSLNISGNVIHSAPGEPVVSIPLALKFVLKVQTLVESGRFPVIKLFRLGPQTACCTYVLLKTILSDASFSRLGALMPYRCVQGAMKGRKSSHTMTSRFLAPAGAGCIGGGGGGGGGGGRTTPKLHKGLRLGVPIAVRKWQACWAVFVFQAVHCLLLTQAAQHLPGDDGTLSEHGYDPVARTLDGEQRTAHRCSSRAVAGRGPAAHPAYLLRPNCALIRRDRAVNSQRARLAEKVHQPLTTPAPPHVVEGVGMTGPEPGVSSPATTATAASVSSIPQTSILRELRVPAVLLAGEGVRG